MVEPVIIVHGGAWSIPDDQVKGNIDGVEEAVKKGWELLVKGCSSLDAVNIAVNCMEDDPLFDAGTGSVLTQEGTVEMDALIMNGENLKTGAVAGLKDVRYPVNLARVVMEKTPHVLMIGKGANKLALEHGLERIQQEKLVTDYARWELEEWLKERRYGETFSHETVGAVALDQKGNLASATSTGGVTGKLVGRVGDVPIVGSGGYADNKIGAVSSTGDGEAILRVNLARLALSYMEMGIKVKEASEKALGYMLERVNGRGGLIAVDTHGNIAHPFSTKRMAWAAIKDDTLTSGINP